MLWNVSQQYKTMCSSPNTGLAVCFTSFFIYLLFFDTKMLSFIILLLSMKFWFYRPETV